MSIIKSIKKRLSKLLHNKGDSHSVEKDLNTENIHPETESIYNTGDPYYDMLEQRRNQAIVDHGWEALNKLHKLCEDNNIKYWLYAGTLLGMIRDKSFIYSDTDVDIGVNSSGNTRIKLEEILPVAGYKKLYEYSVDGEVLEQRFEYKGVGIDFYYTKKYRDGSYVSVFNEKDEKIYLIHERYDRSAFDDLATIDINNMILSIPENYLHVLEQLYGNWQTPITKKDGYTMYSNPNQVHHYDIEAQFFRYSNSIHEER